MKSIFSAAKTSNFISGTSMGRQHFTRYISLKPNVQREPSYSALSLSYWCAQIRGSSPGSYSYNTSSISWLERVSTSIWASLCSMSVYTTLSGSQMRFPTSLWGPTYNWLPSYLTGPWLITLSSRKVLASPKTRVGNSANPSNCMRSNTLPQP
jgi:hypothetical protein